MYFSKVDRPCLVLARLRRKKKIVTGNRRPPLSRSHSPPVNLIYGTLWETATFRKLRFDPVVQLPDLDSLGLFYFALTEGRPPGQRPR